jgi:hypothetical protein
MKERFVSSIVLLACSISCSGESLDGRYRATVTRELNECSTPTLNPLPVSAVVEIRTTTITVDLPDGRNCRTGRRGEDWDLTSIHPIEPCLPVLAPTSSVAGNVLISGDRDEVVNMFGEWWPKDGSPQGCRVNEMWRLTLE